MIWPNFLPPPKNMLTPVKYWEAIGVNMLAGLSTEEFWVLAGRERIDQLIADFHADPSQECCQDAGLMTNGPVAYVDICIYHLKQLKQAHELVARYGSVRNAQTVALFDSAAVGLNEAIVSVLECQKLEKELNVKTKLSEDWNFLTAGEIAEEKELNALVDDIAGHISKKTI